MQVGPCRVSHRARNRRQRRFVENDIDPLARLRARSRIGQVALHKIHGLESGQVAAFAGNKVVNAADRFASRQERSRNRAPNETSRPRH